MNLSSLIRGGIQTATLHRQHIDDLDRAMRAADWLAECIQRERETQRPSPAEITDRFFADYLNAKRATDDALRAYREARA